MIVTPVAARKGMVLPNVQVVSRNLARGWEESVKACWDFGVRIPTQYDKKDDPLSRDIALNLTVLNPFAEPRIHRDMPGGFEDLEIYRREVIEGVHDHWINPDDKKWQYTYHERIAAYSVPGLPQPINQLDNVVDELCEAPHTRRAQCVIWKPWEDAGFEHAACLQSFWFRIFGDKLVMRCRIRSNDAYKAAFMNMYVFTELQRIVAEQVSERLGRLIRVGQYDHIADSFHIYGSYFDEFTGRFLAAMKKKTVAQRTYRTNDPITQQIMAEASVAIDAKLIHEREAGR
ncbi:MAG: thymidylate synthase [Candidatus Berkelbacteria bacterium]|nr:thymidylate synthase [Candidatus Berkelbacteria bacterium]